MTGRDFYAILGVARDVDDDTLKKAYKKQAMKWHPDRHASKPEAERKAAEEKFKDVSEALEVLSDKDKRAVYDRFGEDGLKAGGPAAGGGNMPGGAAAGSGFPGGATSFSFSTGGGGGGGMDAARAQAMFESIFGGMGGMGGMGGGGVRVMRSGGGRQGMGGMGGMGSTSGGMGGGLFDMETDDPFAGLMGGMGGGMSAGGMRGGGMRMRGGAHSPSRVDVLAPGTVVRLDGLNSAAHNGKVGTVESYDTAKDRYVVRLQHDRSSTLAVRPANCVQVVTEAKVVGTSKGELNGKTASCATFDRSAKRYRCEGLRPDGSVVSLKPENVVLPPATRVTIEGVASRPALNGKVGEVRSVDQAAGRYDVQLPDEANVLRLRFGAVAAC